MSKHPAEKSLIDVMVCGANYVQQRIMIWFLLYPLSLSIEAHFSIVVRLNNALDGQVIAFLSLIHI